MGEGHHARHATSARLAAHQGQHQTWSESYP
jgi:hypothetical protein